MFLPIGEEGVVWTQARQSLHLNLKIVPTQKLILVHLFFCLYFILHHTKHRSRFFVRVHFVLYVRMKRPYLSFNAPIAQPKAPTPMTWESAVLAAQPKWTQKILQHIYIETIDNKLEPISNKESLYIVSDGSAKARQMTFGWIISAKPKVNN